jgi:hypothetical protein
MTDIGLNNILLLSIANIDGPQTLQVIKVTRLLLHNMYDDIA